MKKISTLVALVALATMLGGCCLWPYCGGGGNPGGGGPGGPGGGPGGPDGGPGGQGGGGPQSAVLVPHQSTMS
jgi:hypothetical protein